MLPVHRTGLGAHAVTDIESPPSPEASIQRTGDAGEPPTRRGWLRWVLLGAGVLVVIGVGSGLRWRAHYAPLSFEGSTMIELGNEFAYGFGYPGGVLGEGMFIGPGFEPGDLADREMPTVGAAYRDGEHVT